MQQHVTLPVGSPIWAWSFGISVIAVVSILLCTKRMSLSQRETLRRILALFFTLNFFSFHGYALYDGSWSSATTLPLHLCALSNLAGIYALYTKSYRAFVLACYFGIAGGLNSLLTPEFAHGYDAFYHLHYYVEHAGIVLIPLFLRVAFGMKPAAWSWLRIMLLINLLALAMYIFNHFNGSNYMYVNVKPIVDSPLLIGDWPYYIFGLEIVALVHFYLIYVCFHGFKNWY